MEDEIINPYYNLKMPWNDDRNCAKDRESITNVLKPNDDVVYSQIYLPAMREFQSRWCDILPVSKIKFISGVYSFRKYTIESKTIMVFGEYHNSANGCKMDKSNTVSFTGFLQSYLSQNKDNYFDVFSENIYRNKTYPEGIRKHSIGGSYNLDNMFIYFKECLKVDKTNCPWKNARFHYVDYRNTNQTGFGKQDIYIAKDIIKEFIKTDPKIQKQLSKIGPFFTQKINEYVHDYIDAIVPDQKKPLIYLYSVIMDIYTLARMFNPRYENCIVFVGENHASNYATFIEKYLHIKPTTLVFSEVNLNDDGIPETCLPLSIL